MNCLLIDPAEFDPESRHARIAGRRRRHVEEILKASRGDTLSVGLIGGQLGRAEILGLDEEFLDLRVTLECDPPPKRPLNLVLALPRPPVFRRLVSTIASLGVAQLLIVGTARTEKSFWQSHVIESDEIQARLLLGLEQARDTVVPEVEIHRYFEELVSDVLPSTLARSRGLLAHPGARVPCPHCVEGEITVFVGPEGGFIDSELETLRGIGFESVHLGERVLRVEPSIPLLVGRLFG
jgi:RsmE family RNA methyltransferase